MKKIITLIILIFAISIVKSQDWIQIGQDINGSGGDLSGGSISLSSNGSIVAIGARYNNVNGEKAGRVRVYQNISGNWIQIGNSVNGEAEGDEFGCSVSLSSDGSIFAAGAYRNDGNGTWSGHTRIYENISGVWSQVGSDIDGDEVGEQSGNSVCLSSDGSIVAIGTKNGKVKVYQNNSGVWTQVGNTIYGLSGYVSINSTGTIVAVSDPYYDGNGSNSGQVRVFENISEVWTQIGQSINGEAAEDFSGGSIDLNSGGTILAIGAKYNDGNGNNSGHARVFHYNESTWEQLGSDIDGVGGSESGDLSLNDDGSVIAVGAWREDGNGTDAGHVRVYKYNEASWIQYGNDIDGKSQYYCSGISTSINNDGTIVAIGVLYNGGETIYMAPCINENTPIPDTDPLPDITAECFFTVINQPTATDECGNTLYGTTTDPLTYNEIGTYTITWTYEDDQGNTIFQDQTIIISEDFTNPVITCVSNQEVNADETHYYIINETEFDPTEASDNCYVESIENNYNNQSTLAGASLPEGTTQISWTITDEAGNTNNCIFEVLVNEYVGIKNVNYEIVRIYPNPTDGIINITSNINHNGKITISDITGKILLEKTEIHQNEIIDLSNFESGIYLISLQTENEMFNAAIIKR